MIYNAESRIGNFKNSFGNEIVFYARQSEYDVLLSDGSTITARHAWMKSDKQKDHSSAVRWMGDGGLWSHHQTTLVMYILLKMYTLVVLQTQ